MTQLQIFKPITTFVFDVDGVLTDGTILLLENGLQARRMSIKDGYALQLAVKKGYSIVVISGGSSPEVRDRLNLLGVTDVHMSIKDKKAVLENYITSRNLKREEILYMGDDIPDLIGMSLVGLPACPADAVEEIKQLSKHISAYKGGYGCVREVIENVLKANNHWSDNTGVTSS